MSQKFKVEEVSKTIKKLQKSIEEGFTSSDRKMI